MTEKELNPFNDTGSPKIVVNNVENNIPEALVVDIKRFYEMVCKDKLERGLYKKEDIEKRVNGEKSFFIRVINTVDQAIRAIRENQDKKVVMLFDLDETLVKNKRNKDNEYDTVLRPSALALLHLINQKGAAVGFLTNRTELQSQLSDKLKILESLVDKHYLFSTRGTEMPETEKDNLEKTVPENLKHVLLNGDYEKIKFLNDLNMKSEYQKNVFIPVDDFKYPALFKYGVALNEKELFYL